MTWTAELTASAFDERSGVGKFSVRYTRDRDGKIINRNYSIQSPGNDYIQQQARQDARNLTAIDAYASTKILGQIDISENTRTPEQLVVDAFFEKLLLYRAWNRAIDEGVATPTADYTTLKATVNSDFKPDYLSDPRY